MKKNILTIAVLLSLCLSCNKDEVTTPVSTLDTSTPQLLECTMPVYCGEEKQVSFENYTQNTHYSYGAIKVKKTNELKTYVIDDDITYYDVFKNGLYLDDMEMYPNEQSLSVKTHKKTVLTTNEEVLVPEKVTCEIGYYYIRPNFDTLMLVGIVDAIDSKSTLSVDAIVETDCGITVYYKREYDKPIMYNNMDYVNYYQQLDLNKSTAFAIIPKTNKKIEFKEVVEQKDYVLFGKYSYTNKSNSIFYKIEDNQMRYIHSTLVPNMSELNYSSPIGTEISVDIKQLEQFIPKQFIGVEFNDFIRMQTIIPIKDWIYVELMINNRKTSIHLPVDQEYYSNNPDLIALKNHLINLMSILNY